MLIPKCILVATVLLVAGHAQAETSRPVSIGYIPAFKGMGPIMAKADLTQYTHLNVSFVNPTPAGDVMNGDVFACMNDETHAPVNAAAFSDAVQRAHANGSKILVSLGGGYIPACSGNWAELLSPALRPVVVQNLIALVERFGLDGIDVDIEGALLTEIDKAGNYTLFIKELSRELKARGKLLTCATASYEGGMVPETSLPYFDLVNIMSYDVIGETWGRPGDEHASYADAEAHMNLWRQKGVPKEKLVLGVPFYGRGFGDYAEGYKGFRDLLARHGDAVYEKDVLGERCAGCGYVTYNGLPTLRRKARLAVSKGAGIMVWEISQDTDDHRLIRAMNTEMAR